MRKILFLLTIVLLAAVSSYSQAPGIFNYQGVARNSVGNVLANKSITLRLTIHDGTAAGPTVYQESRGVITNPFGLFNVQVGSPGGTNVTGNIPGVSWGVGAKYIQVEIDPNGGTTFINIGTAQLASVPYALFANSAADLILPFNKTQADAGTLFKITNSGTGSGSTALEGLTNSTAGNVSAVIGTVTSVAPGAFSAGVRGINNGTGGNGIGVYGSQNGSGYGVYGTAPSGWAIRGESTSGVGSFGSSTSGTGVFGTSTSGAGVFGLSNTGNAGLFTNTNAANTATTVDVSNNGTNNAINSVNTGTGRAGFFQVNNAASGADALSASTNGTATSWAIRGNSTGLQGAGIFTYNNAAGTANALRVTNNGSGAGVYSTSTGTGASGFFENTNVTNPNNTLQVIDANTTTFNFNLGNAIYAQRSNNIFSTFFFTTPTTTTSVSQTGFGIQGTSETGTGIAGLTNTGVGIRAFAFDPAAYALITQGRVQISGQGAALNRVLTSDALGNATWQNLGAIGGVTGSGTVNFIPKWTPIGTNLGNSQLFDNGQRVSIGTFFNDANSLTINNTAGLGNNASVSLQGNGGFGNSSGIYLEDATNKTHLTVNGFTVSGGTKVMTLDGATQNVGIGTATPTYRLDVLHGGGTGANVQSTAGFSVVDINAFNGDAALRFRGGNGWHIGNGLLNGLSFSTLFGPTRMMIVNNTGEVDINANNTTSAKLTVLGQGSTDLAVTSGNVRTAVHAWNDVPGATNNVGIVARARQSTGSNTGLMVDLIQNTAGVASSYLGTNIVGTSFSTTSNMQGSNITLNNTGTGSITLSTNTATSGGGGVSMGSNVGVGQTGVNGLSNTLVASTGNVTSSSYTAVASAGAASKGSNTIVSGGTGQAFGETNTIVAPGANAFGTNNTVVGVGAGSTSTGATWTVVSGSGSAIGEQFTVTSGNPTPAPQTVMGVSANVNATGITTSANAAAAVANPAGDFTSNGGQGVHSSVIKGYTNPFWGSPIAQGIVGDATTSGAGIVQQQGVLGVGANGSNFNWGVYGVIQGPAGSSNNAAVIGLDQINVANSYAGFFVGKMTATGTKLFTIDHPLDPANKILHHAAVESNEVLNMYSGNITTDANGFATVNMPDYFEALNKDFRYQLTVVGTFAQAIVKSKVSNNKFIIQTNQPNIEVSWEVKGVRNDAWMRDNPMVVEETKSNDAKGKYIYPQGFGKGMEASMMGIIADPNMQQQPPATPAKPIDLMPEAAKKALALAEELKAKAKNVNTNFKPAETKQPEVSIKGTSMDPDAKPVQVEQTKPAGRTAEEIEKAKQQEEQNKVQPAKTDAPKTEAAQLPADNGVKVSTPTKKD